MAEMLDWVKTGEAALSGTAAVLAGVGALVCKDKEYPVGDGDVGPHTKKLRVALVGIQQGEIRDTRGWLTRV